MTITVSITQFRQNIADYLAKAKEGYTILLKDEKKDEPVAELTGKRKFNLERFKKTLKKTAGTFSAKNHPEWRTKKNVIKWLEKSRQVAERTF
jgi:antitoxin (DNA-binding transcriptional repressor) of toxin-antitoxin stability system